MFTIVNTSKPPLQSSLSPLRPKAWLRFLTKYPSTLNTLLVDILTYGAQIGYKGPNQLLLSKNLTSADDNRP